MKVISIDPEWEMEVCTKFHGNPSNCGGDIELRPHANLMGALEVKSVVVRSNRLCMRKL